MRWDVDLHDDFVPEFDLLDEAVQNELLAHIAVLETFGPQLGRPRVDTLNGSLHANIKELRFDVSDGVWRFAFAFDPKTQSDRSVRLRQVRGQRQAGSIDSSSPKLMNASTLT